MKHTDVEVLTYVVMDNHFQMLVRVVKGGRFATRFEGSEGEAALLKHLEGLFTYGYATLIERRVRQLRLRGANRKAEKILQEKRDKLEDLVFFMKQIKQRCARRRNLSHGGRGTFWHRRYASAIVEDEETLLGLAVDIDLVPVRMGVCEDSRDHRWCGYVEADAGSRRARRGLCRVMGRFVDSWKTRAARSPSTGPRRYRALLKARRKELMG